MKFRTEIKPLNAGIDIHHQSNIVAIGSCFVENIGNMMLDHGFNISVNPFGILFNPVSILNILENKKLTPQHLIEKSNSVVSLDFHSKFQAKNKLIFQVNFENKQHQLQNQLQNANCLILTFGTAWVYRYKQTKEIIANCQKVEGQSFTKELLNLNHLMDAYTAYFNKLIQLNPTLKIILTVSPVRHIKDGIVENNVSKSVLLLLCQKLKNKFSDHIVYYPSYEILLDDLRDYRFYKSDLIHPNNQAIQYIYEHFSNSFYQKKTKEIVQLMQKLNALKAHQFLNPTEKDKNLHASKIKRLELEIKNAI